MKKDRKILSDGISLPKSPLRVREHFFLGDSWTPAIESGEWIPCFLLPAHVGFALPIKLSIPQSMSFVTPTLLILFPIPMWLEWASDCVVFSCWIGLNHYIIWTQARAFGFTPFCHILAPHLSFSLIYEDGQVFGLWTLVPSMILLLLFKVVCLCIRKFLMWIWGQMWTSICILIKSSGGYWFLGTKNTQTNEECAGFS